MPLPSVKVHSFRTLDAKVTLQGSLSSRALLANKFDTDPSYESVQEEGGENNWKEVIVCTRPVLKFSFSGKVLQLSGTYNSLAPMSALHKSVLPLLTADNDHGFGTQSTTNGYLVCSGKLAATNSALAEASIDGFWFEEANTIVTKVTAPSAP